MPDVVNGLGKKIYYKIVYSMYSFCEIDNAN